MWDTQGEAAALDFLHREAKAGNRYAQMRLAQWYSEGKQQDMDEMRRWLTAAAEQGDAHAQFQLAWLEDGRKGEQWLERAAAQGYAPAQAHLAQLQQQRGESGNAREWFAKAAAQGDADAQYEYGVQLWQAGDEAALHWLALAAEQGHVAAQFEVGMVHYVRGDAALARSWWQQAAANGHAQAVQMLRR